MIKIKNLLTIALTFLLMVSCIPNKEEIANLTDTEKITLLNNYSWLVAKPIKVASNGSSLKTTMQEESNCSLRNYIAFSINPKKIEDYYSGGYNQYNFFNEGVCLSGKSRFISFKYYPLLNKVIYNNSDDFSTSSIAPNQAADMPKEESLTIDNKKNTINFGGTTYYKGELRD
ncbi:MAG: hypothetical protein ACEQSF_03510 [Solirubrobacteraceae bacterium]